MKNIIGVRKDVPSGTIVINNPSSGNALTTFGMVQLRDALGDLHQEKNVRAVILTGSQRIFCSGTDLKQLQSDLDTEEMLPTHHDVELLAELLMVMLRFPKPIIAALNGPAVGLGLAIALAADFIIAAEGATLQSPEIHRGLVPGLTLGLLEFRVGGAIAARFGLMGATMTSAEAKQFGLVHDVVDDELIWARAQQLAVDLAQGSAQAQQMCKKLLNETIAERLETTLTLGAAMVAASRTTSHAIEGINAYLEKRSPDWD
jgi:enoyl-CoA hydratase/carnithine racemase